MANRLPVKLANESAFGVYRFSWTSADGARMEVQWGAGMWNPLMFRGDEAREIVRPERFGWKTPKKAADFKRFAQAVADEFEAGYDDDELAELQARTVRDASAEPGLEQGTSRRFEVTRVPQREGYGILSVLDPASRHVPDPFLLLIDGRAVGGTYWCPYNPAPSGFGRDDGGLPGQSWASWGPRGLSCGHPTRESAEQAQVDVYKTDPDGWDMRLTGGHAELSPERDRPDGARFWDHRTHRDFWAGYAATLARVRYEQPSTADGLAAILNRFQAPSAGTAFFGNNADDQLCDALADAGWDLRFLERDYLWEARHPGTGERLHYVEGDVYPGPYKTVSSSKPSAPTQSADAKRPIDHPDPVTLGAATIFHPPAAVASHGFPQRPARRRTGQPVQPRPRRRGQ